MASGVIEILSDEDNQSPIISFTAGTCIGESALVLSLPAKATMRAANYTEVQVTIVFFLLSQVIPALMFLPGTLQEGLSGNNRVLSRILY